MSKHLSAGGTACGLLACWAAPAAAQDLVQEVQDTPTSSVAAAGEGEPELSELSIEELAQIQVRSASKREEPLSAAPTALFVITGEDIVNSAATSLPEALRLAPNLEVQQVDAAQYAISARGFNGIEASNKLLVLIDGRTIYTPLSSGVLWELHAPLLEDIDQIEVISGPGGTLYGPNAVNGVVNVTTHSALETIGTLARGSIGEEERNAAFRHGFAIGDSGAIRFYADWHQRDALPAGAGAERNDRYEGWQAGFRADFTTEDDQITVQGDIFDQESFQVAGDGATGQNLLARWSRVLSPNASFQLQAYYDKFERQVLLTFDALETFDGEAQVNLTLGRHELVAGLGARTLHDLFTNDLNVFNLDPRSRRLWVFNAFVQDRIHLSERLSLIAGLKLERTTFTGVEALPNLRLAWQPNEDMLLWAAVSRAVRTPSRIDRQLTAPGFLAAATGFDSEKLVALEAGYRGQPFASTSLSINFFFNFYTDLRSTELTNGGLPIQLQNGISGHTYGVEAWSNTQLLPWWRLALGVSTLWKEFKIEPGRVDLAQFASTGDDPTWQLFLRSHMDLTPRLQLTAGLRAIDELSRVVPIDSYVEAEAHLSYRLTDNLELYVSGRNLLHDTHAESNDPQRAQLAERSILFGTRVRF